MCVTATASAQSPAPHPPTPIADAATRMARDLWPTHVDPAVQANRPIFRVTVGAWAPLPVPWHLTEKPGPSNPRFNGHHQEHLMVTTPQAFRTSTFYPMGMSIDPGTIVKGARRTWRDWRTSRIRRRIAEELAELEKANAAAPD